MKRWLAIAPILAGTAWLIGSEPNLGGLSAQAGKSVENEIGKLLDHWHAAAARADESAYFNPIAQAGVFLGTDATERWDKEAFRAYTRPYFQKGHGWTFKSTRRAIRVSTEETVAWFDEDLASTHMGPCRGTGVLIKEAGAWRIAQYNLTVPIPNAIFPQVRGLIEKELAKPKPNS